MMDRRLNSLEPEFRAKVYELLARCIEANLPVKIVNTRRTAEEQAKLVASGQSWVKHSKHQDGLAIDICPYEIYAIAGADKLEWNADSPTFKTIGFIGESLGLVWGGRWTMHDMGHFEAPDHSATTKSPLESQQRAV